MSGFTQEMRDKAIAVRRQRALERAQGKPVKGKPKEKGARLLPKKGNGKVDDRIPIQVAEVAPPPEFIPLEFWNHAPLPEAIERFNDLEREYKRAAQVILQRRSQLPQTYVCWCTLNKSKVPKSVLAQCKGSVQDGKWNMKDDGAHIVTCSNLCTTVYLQNKPIGGLGRR